jgi:hypothetical protein
MIGNRYDESEMPSEGVTTPGVPTGVDDRPVDDAEILVDQGSSWVSFYGPAGREAIETKVS